MTLHVDSVTHRFGSQTALDKVSLHVREGDLYGFLGHNGAGKTTTMRIALGLIRPKSGRIVVDGFDAEKHPLEARARMGALIEAPGFYRRLDGRKNLVLLGRLQGMSRREVWTEADRLLELVGLSDVGRKPVGRYSQGMRQRLGVAQAILGSPKIVLLDEPMNGLDPEGIREMRELLRRLTRDEGITILLSSHQLREISDLCNRIAVIRQGKVLVEEESQSLLADGGRRHRILTSDDARACTIFDDLGLEHEQDVGTGRIVSLDSVSPATVARRIVEDGNDLIELASLTPSLEEVYHHFTGGGHEREAARSAPSKEAARAVSSDPQVAVDGSEPAASADGTASTSGETPIERIAPGMPVFRVMRHEFARWSSYAAVPFLVCVPAVLALLAILGRKRESESLQAELDGAELASTTAVTAFEGVGVGLSAGLPLLMIVITGIASQAIAGGLNRGTLRNVLLRPVTRMHVAAGKGVSLLGLGMLGYLFLVGASILASSWFFEFGDVAEILPNGEPFPLVEASELFPELYRVLVAPLLPLAAFASIGFLAGTVARSGTAALAIAIGTVIFLDVFRVMAREYEFEGWLPTAHLPSPLGDVSFVRYYSETVQGVSNVAWDYAGQAWTAPGLWILVAFLCSIFSFRRRAVS